MQNSPSIEEHDEIMTDEEQRYQEEFQKIVDREVGIESSRLETLSIARNFIRQTDWEDKEIASVLEVDEDYVKDVRYRFQRLSKEEQNKWTIDLDFEQLVRNIAEVQQKVRWAYNEFKDGFFDVNAMDEEISLRTWVNLEMVKRLRLDLFPGMDRQFRVPPWKPLKNFRSA